MGLVLHETRYGNKALSDDGSWTVGHTESGDQVEEEKSAKKLEESNRRRGEWDVPKVKRKYA